MNLVFLYGPPAAGKLTVARKLADIIGYALFHNHLVIDAVMAVFPFGSEPFVRLREAFWLAVIEEAARAGRSTIFTYAPEGTVAPDFPERVAKLVQALGGRNVFVHLTVSRAEQERRIDDPSRSKFGKITSLDLLRQLRDKAAACEAAMPPAELTIESDTTPPEQAARRIADYLGVR